MFQNAACNWRCWYCYVPFNLLSANEKRGAWVTANSLVEQFLAEPGHPDMIDLTGGQPDLVPEWIPWTLQALESAEADKSVYVWSDDNLSNDYFFRYLPEKTQHRVAEHPGYGRVCCFKGFDEASFSFNTKARQISSTASSSCSHACWRRGWICTHTRHSPLRPLTPCRTR